MTKDEEIEGIVLRGTLSFPQYYPPCISWTTTSSMVPKANRDTAPSNR